MNFRDLLSMLTRYTRGSTSTLPCSTEENEFQGPSLYKFYVNQVYQGGILQVLSCSTEGRTFQGPSLYANEVYKGGGGIVQARCYVLQREGNSRDLYFMLKRYRRVPYHIGLSLSFNVKMWNEYLQSLVFSACKSSYQFYTIVKKNSNILLIPVNPN